MLSATVNAALSIQNCQNLPKSAQRQLAWRTLKCHQKLRFSCFSKIRISMCRRSIEYMFTIWIFNAIIFLMFFYCQRRPLYVNFNISPWGKWFFSQCSTPLVGMRFWGHVTNSLRNKNIERHIPYLLFLNGYFGLQNSTVSLGHRGKKKNCQL
jgi:hypothetical protein